MSAILARWSRPQDFYAERDNRTELEVHQLALYATQPVEIVVDPFHAHTPAVQQAALIACNLTSRWARQVTVSPAGDALHVEGRTRAERWVLESPEIPVPSHQRMMLTLPSETTATAPGAKQ